jgi:hypothetical protein
MIGEINIAGIFISPLLPCLMIGFAARLLVSKAMDWADLYRFVWRRQLFDTFLSFVFVGLAFECLRVATTGNG